MKLTLAIWMLNSLLQWVLVAAVLRKNRWRQHLAFAIYIAFCACKTNLLMWLGLYRPSSYLYVNWGLRAVSLPLMIAVLIEVFAKVFQPYSTLPKGTLRWFKIALGVLVLLTACAAHYFPGSTPGNIVNAISVANRSVSIIFCGAFAFTALVSAYYGIPWQTRTYGIATGFLLFTSVDLFAASLMAAYGTLAASALGTVSMLGYSLALITWITYFAVPDVKVDTPTLEQVRRLQRALDYAPEKVESCHGTE